MMKKQQAWRKKIMLQNCTLVCNKKLVSWIIVIYRALYIIYKTNIYGSSEAFLLCISFIFGICFVFLFSMSKYISKIFFKVKFFVSFNSLNVFGGRCKEIVDETISGLALWIMYLSCQMFEHTRASHWYLYE